VLPTHIMRVLVSNHGLDHYSERFLLNFLSPFRQMCKPAAAVAAGSVPLLAFVRLHVECVKLISFGNDLGTKSNQLNRLVIKCTR
jgi:hypothetical protein